MRTPAVATRMAIDLHPLPDTAGFGAPRRSPSTVQGSPAGSSAAAAVQGSPDAASQATEASGSDSSDTGPDDTQDA